MDIKETILRFLYDNNNGQKIDLSLPLTPFDNDRTGIRKVLDFLKNHNIIDIHPYYVDLSGKQAGKHTELRFCHVEGQLTPTGEKYVKELYYTKNEPTPTIQAQNVSIVHGNNSGQIAQTEIQSSSSEGNFQVKPTQIKNKPDKISIILTIIGLFLTALGVYYAYLQLHNPVP